MNPPDSLLSGSTAFLRRLGGSLFFTFLATAMVFSMTPVSSGADCPDGKCGKGGSFKVTVKITAEMTGDTAVIPSFTLDDKTKAGISASSGTQTFNLGPKTLKIGQAYPCTLEITGIPSGYASNGTTLKAEFSKEDACGIIVETKPKDAANWTEGNMVTAPLLSKDHPKMEFFVRLRRKAPEDEGGNGSSSAAQGQASSADISADSAWNQAPGSSGLPSGLVPADYNASILLGATPQSGGFNTGSLDLSGVISSALANVANLRVRDPDENSLHVVNVSGNIRQVTNLHRLADVITLSGGGFEVRLYEAGTFGTILDSGSGLYPINSGATAYQISKYTPVSAGSGHYGGVHVEVTGANGLTLTTDVISTSADGLSWRSVGNIETIEHSSFFDFDTDTSQWVRTDETIIKRDSILYSKSQQVYLYQYLLDGSTIIESHLFQLENSEFYNTDEALVTTWTPNSTFLGLAASMKRPDGSWEAYTYYDGTESGASPAWRGRIKQTLRPWNNSPTEPSAATTSNSECTTHTYEMPSITPGIGYSVGTKGLATTLPGSSGPVTSEKSELTASSVHVDDLIDLLEDAGVDTAWLPDAATLREESTKKAASASEWIVSPAWIYDSVDVPNSPWLGKSFADLDSTGKGTVIGYETGSYNNSTGAFTANNFADPPSSWGTDIKMTEVNVMDFGAPVAFEATKTVTISDRQKKSLRRELWIKDSSSWNLATTTTWEYPQLWPDGSARETIQKQDGRIASHTIWNSALEMQSSDAQGINTIRKTDSLGRIVSSTIEGVSGGTGYEAQSDRVTSYAYAGRSTTTVITSDALSKTSTITTDLAGREISSTNISGRTRTLNYSNEGRTVTTTDPEGVQTIRTTSLDGRAVSKTGSGVIDTVVEAEILSSGNLLTISRTGDVTSSPRYTSTETDWAGRKISTRTPSFEGYGEISYSTIYQEGTTRLRSSATVAGMMLSEYPTPGSSLNRSGYSLADPPSSSLDPSSDAVADTVSSYALEGGFWWEISTTSQHDGNSTTPSALVSITKRCLNGVPGSGLSGKFIRIEPSGATYTTVTELNRTTRTRTTSTTWNGSSNPEVQTDVNGLVISRLGREGGSPTKWTYDGLGRKLTETSPRGSMSRITYGSNGQVATKTDAYNQTTVYDYYGPSSKSGGRIARITHPDGTTTTYTYDDLGNIKETAGTGEYRVTYDYDDYGVQTKMSTYQSNTPDTTEWLFDSGTGLLLEKKYADGNKTTFVYTPSTLLLYQRKWARSATIFGTSGTSNVTTTYGYFPTNGFLDRVYSATHSDSGVSEITSIDRLGRPVYRLVMTSPSDYRGEWFGYHAGTGAPKHRYHEGTASSDPLLGIGIRWPDVDSAGRPTGYSETSGDDTTVVRTVSYSYDAAGRLDTISDGGSTPTQTHTYGYASGSSQVTSLESKTNGATTWFKELRNLDSSGRLIGIQSNRMSDATTVLNRISTYAYSYDALGRRTQATLQDGSRWNYGYNDRSEVTSATRNDTAGNPIAALSATYAYDGIGNRTESNSDVLGNHTYTANNLNQYDTITTGNSRTAAGRAPASWSVSVYPTGGTPATATRPGSGQLYYKALTASNSSAPAWQEVVTSATDPAPMPPATVSSTNHLWYAKASFTPVYDLDGNLTDDGRWTYTWDAQNQLVQMETTSEAVTAGHLYTKLAFKYDQDGHRIERAVWQGGSSGSSTFLSRRRWLYDGWNPVVEFDSNEDGTTNTRINTFTWGLDIEGTLQNLGGVGALITQTTISGATIRRASYDGNGNIVAWTRSDNTSAECRREYDAFGNVLISEGLIPSEYGFSTKIQDPLTAQLYYGLRSYDPVTGRWLNRDPLREAGGFNLYGFIDNNTTNDIDKFGLASNNSNVPETPSLKVFGEGYYGQCPKDQRNGEKWTIEHKGIEVPDDEIYNITATDTVPTFGGKAERRATSTQVIYSVRNPDGVGEIERISPGQTGSFNTYYERGTEHSFSLGVGAGEAKTISGSYSISWSKTTGMGLSVGPYGGETDKNEYVGLPVELHAKPLYTYHYYEATYYGAPWKLINQVSYAANPVLKVSQGIMVCKRKCVERSSGSDKLGK